MVSVLERCPLRGSSLYIFLSMLFCLYFLACARFALFCEMFTKYKAEMSRDERYEIIKSIKSRFAKYLRIYCI